MQDLQKVPFLFLLEINLNSNSDYIRNAREDSSVKLSRQSYKLASFLSHTHTLLFNKNSVPTKRQSYHTFPPPLRC